MLEEYKERVLSDYQKKKEEFRLSSNLMNPSPANLRDECLIVYHERYNPKDDEILRLFFTARNNDGNYSKSIENFNIDELRPLSRLLNGKRGRPRDRNINLLSWLIDFEPRPYRFVPPNGNPGIDIENPITGDVKIDVTKEDQPTQDDTIVVIPQQANLYLWLKELWLRPVFRNSLLTSILILLTSSGAVVYWKFKHNQCMYWTGDHYEAVSCDEKVDASVIVLNEKVKHLRKITRLDTITRNAIGNVWYAKIKVDSAEFYTDSGVYPLDTRKRLLPVTDYMLNKYIFAKRVSKDH